MPTRARSRTKSYPRRKLDEDFRGYIDRNRALLFGVTAGYVALGVSASVLELLLIGEQPYFLYALGFFHAVWIALAVGALTMIWLASSPDAINYLRGALGEDNTEDVLKAARRTSIWGFVAGVTIDGGDIDHLVVTRTGGVLAMDSKWRNEASTETVQQMADSARKSARRAEIVMRSETIGTLKRDSSARHRTQAPSYRVRPVVVMWGGTLRSMPDTHCVDDVEFVAGPTLKRWLRTLDGQGVDEVAAKDLLARLTDFRATVRV